MKGKTAIGQNYICDYHHCVAPYFAKGAERLAERLGDKAAQEAFELRGKIWQLIKDLFGEDELTLLHLFAGHPEDLRTQGKLESKLEDRLTDRPEAIGPLVKGAQHSSSP